MSWRRKGIRFGVLAVALMSLLQVASASQINIAGTKVGFEAQTSSPCATNALAVTNTTTGTTATQATISGLDATNCAGKTIQLWLRNATATLTATAGTVTGSSATLTVPGYTTAAIVDAIVYVGDWGAQTTWTYSPPPLFACVVTNDATKNCTAAVTLSSTGTGTWTKTIQVTTTSSGTVTWQVTMNLSDPSIPFLAKRLNDDQWRLTKVSSTGCSTNPLLVVFKGSIGYNQVTPSAPISFQITGRNTSGFLFNELLNC